MSLSYYHRPPKVTPQSLVVTAMSAQPAHKTKHCSFLDYQFNHSHFQLAQLDNGISNGTALWLGAQCLSYYLAENHAKYRQPEMSAIELGSGIGLTAWVSAHSLPACS